MLKTFAAVTSATAPHEHPPREALLDQEAETLGPFARPRRAGRLLHRGRERQGEQRRSTAARTANAAPTCE